MADSIKFTIGGQLGASYRGALTQAVTEAKAANVQLMRGNLAMQAEFASANKALSGKLVKGTDYASLAYNAQIMAKIKSGEEQITHLKNAQSLARIGMAKKEAAAIAAIQLEESVAANLLVARGFGAKANNPSGLHGGGGGLTGIIRESVVIAREIAMGRGGGRIAGSVTLLAQYMGLLGKVVHSTAQEQLFASAAASKLSQSMNAEAAAAKGTAAYAALNAAAVKQETVAVKAATEAEIALQTAKVSINPLGWVLIAGVAITAVLVGWIWHLHTLAVRVKNLTDLMDPLKKKYTEQAEALRDDAKAHQEYLDWLKKVGDEHESLPDKISAVIKKLREQAQAEMELARAKGAGKMALEQMEESALQAELNVVTLGKLQARREAEDAQDAADSAAAAFTTNPAENGVDLHGANRVAKNAGEIMDAIQAKMEASEITTGGKITGGSSLSGFTRTSIVTRPANEGDKFTVKVGDKEITTSVAEAKAAFDKATAQSERLTQVQKQLADTLSDTKTTYQEKIKAVESLTKEAGDLEDQLGIKQTFGRKIAAEGGRAGKVSESDWERAGLFQSAGGVSLHDVLKESLKVQRNIEKNTGHHAGKDESGGFWNNNFK